MRIISHRPPILYELICLFISTPPAGALFTFGDKIYAPAIDNFDDLPWDLYIHEREHMKQQGKTPWLWWLRYLTSKRFRIAQETQAYAAQLRMFPRSQRAWVARYLAQHLSGSMYGDAIAQKDAYDAITTQNYFSKENTNAR